MRFIIREQEYERLVAAGRLSHFSAGLAAGILESWRLTSAVDGYHVVRVDVDQRDSALKSSTLIHLLLSPDGQVERMKLRRFRSPGIQHDVDVVQEGDLLRASYAAGKEVSQFEVDLSDGQCFLVPSSIGLALVARRGPRWPNSAVTLDEHHGYAPSAIPMEIVPLAKEVLTVTGQVVAVQSYLIQVEQTKYRIWLDGFGLPIQLKWGSNQQAIEDRYVRHRALDERVFDT